MRHGLKRGNRGRHDAREAGTILALRTRSRTGRREKKSGDAPERQVGVVVSSKTRSQNGGRGKGGPSTKYIAAYR